MNASESWNNFNNDPNRNAGPKVLQSAGTMEACRFFDCWVTGTLSDSWAFLWAAGFLMKRKRKSQVEFFLF